MSNRSIRFTHAKLRMCIIPTYSSDTPPCLREYCYLVCRTRNPLIISELLLVRILLEPLRSPCGRTGSSRNTSPRSIMSDETIPITFLLLPAVISYVCSIMAAYTFIGFLDHERWMKASSGCSALNMHVCMHPVRSGPQASYMSEVPAVSGQRSALSIHL